MATRENADRHQPDDARLANNSLLDFLFELKGALAPIGELLDDVQRIVQGLTLARQKEKAATISGMGPMRCCRIRRLQIVAARSSRLHRDETY